VIEGSKRELSSTDITFFEQKFLGHLFTFIK